VQQWLQPLAQGVNFSTCADKSSIKAYNLLSFSNTGILALVNRFAILASLLAQCDRKRIRKNFEIGFGYFIGFFISLILVWHVLFLVITTHRFD
jgi:hypothetical protein